MNSAPPHLGSPYAWQPPTPHTPVQNYRSISTGKYNNSLQDVSREVEKHSKLYLTLFTGSMPYLVQQNWPLQWKTIDVYKQYDCKRCSPWRGMHSLPRRSLALKRLTLSQYTAKWNALPPVKCTAFHALILTRFTNEQHHYMQISYIEFHRNRNIYVESADRNSFKPPPHTQ